MKRISLYLLRVFSGEALALFAVALFLLFLIQCLRIFDIVSVKGQGIFTLIGQAVLGMPALSVVFLYVCLAIGLGRALRRLQGSNELQIIHSSRLVPRLLSSALAYAVFGALAVLVIAHLIEPLANRQLRDWTTSIAADLVSNSLTPHRFTEIAPGVSLLIGGRADNGEITEFFADDRRNPDAQRSYIAKAATIAEDEAGYVLQLKHGALQYLTDDGEFSEVSFERYDMALERLTGAIDAPGGIEEQTSIEIVASALQNGWSDEMVRQLLKRSGEALRVIAMCLLVLPLAAFPHGQRRRFEWPIEIVVLAAAFVERGLTAYIPAPGGIAPFSGAIALAALAILALIWRLRRYAPARAQAALASEAAT